MRPQRLGFGGAICTGLLAVFWACIPHPEQDFLDYQTSIKDFKGTEIEASVAEVAPPPTQSVQGLYYGACLTELALGNVKKVFNFLTETKFTPVEGQGGKLQLTISVLTAEGAPPATVAKANAVGNPIASPEPAGPNTDAAGKFTLDLGSVEVPGKGNPISGSDALITTATLVGRFSEAKFCGRLGGNVEKPVAAARSLAPEKNICQFVPIKDGDPTPTFTLADFQAASCPLE